jgi:hypothetical protein
MATLDLRPEKPWLPQRKFYAAAQRAQRPGIRFRADSHALGQIMENIEVVGEAETGIGTVNDRTACEMAFWVSVRCQNASDLALEGG